MENSRLKTAAELAMEGNIAWESFKKSPEIGREQNEQRGEKATDAVAIENIQPTEDDLAYQKWLGQNESRSQEQYDNEYSGGTEFSKARNINDKSGKERAYKEWDLYNIQRGETSREFGDRTKERHEEEQKAVEREKLLNRVQQLYYEGKLTKEDYYKRMKTIMNASKIERTEDSAPAIVQEDDISEEETEAPFEVAPATAQEDANDGEKNITSGEIEIEIQPEEVEKDGLEDAVGNKAEEVSEDSAEKAEIAKFYNQLKELAEKFDENDKKEIEFLQDKISNLRPDLAELYARNRRLIVGNKNRELFENTQLAYAKTLDRLLKLKTEQAYKNEQSEKWSKLSDEDIANAYTSVREGMQSFKESHPEATDAELKAEEERLQTEATKNLLDFEGTRTKANTAFLSEYLKQQNALEAETVIALDQGTIWRRFTHNVLANKKVKIILAGIGAAGLVATGVGAFAAGGTLALGFAGWTGVASGAARGALSGAILSREDSKNSAVHNLMTDEDYANRVREISISDMGNTDINNVAMFLMNRYDEASRTDRSDNKKRTALSAGIGAVIGGILGGVQINKTFTATETRPGEITGYEPTQTEYKTAIDSISHAKGKGTEKLFLELGGKSSEEYYSSGAHKMLLEIGKKYGFTEGHSGWTHPGHISEWPSAAQGMAREVAEMWAKNGLIPATINTTGGEAIYGPAIKEAVTHTVREGIFSNFLQGTATTFAGATGALLGGLAGSRNVNQTEPEPVQAQPEVQPEPASPEEDVDDLFRVEADNATTTSPESTSETDFEGTLNQFFEERNVTANNVAIRLLSSEDSYDDTKRAVYENLWSSFDEPTRKIIRDWFEGIRTRERADGSQIDQGRGLRTWLERADEANSSLQEDANA